MIGKDVYGISGAKVVRGEERPYTREAIFTNDPIELVNRCLTCTALSCEHGICVYTKTAERRPRKKYNEQTMQRFVQMVKDGWRFKPLCREIGITEDKGRSLLRYAKKEGRL